MIKISVITPVYNDENYLKESLTSVINQTLEDIEIICVNDGSTDNSLNILNEFADKYDFIKVFSQENQGSGKARNFGIENANGEYIAFLDADDFFIDENALKLMYESAIKYDSDMVSANIKVYNGELIDNYNLDKIYNRSIISSKEYGIPWSFYKNIFKKSLLIENNILFPELLRGQDVVFLAKILTKIDTIVTVPIDLYAYRDINDDVLSKINTYEKTFDYIKHFKETFDILNESGYKKMVEDYEKRYLEFLESRNYDAEVRRASRNVFLNDRNILYKYIPKVSVVIPIYNVSEFLRDSLSSLLNQTLPEIELICVNDGSKDDSLEILEEFAKIDDRVKVIDKPNGGCGSARNRALDEVHGDYIYFFDPDDYILPSALEVLYNNAINNNSDLVMFKIAWFMDGESVDYSTPIFNFDELFQNVDFNEFTFNYKDILPHVLNSGFAPWSKLYNKDFLDKYDDFRFDLGVAFDDVPFHVKSVLRAEKISFSPYFFYHYRYANPNSVNNTPSNGIDIMKIVDIVEDFIKKEGYFEELKEEFYIFKVNQITMYMLSSHSEDYFQLAKKRLLELDIKDIKHIPPHIYKKYERTVDSDSFKEYKFKLDIDELKNELIYKNNELNKKKDELIQLNQKLTNKNDKLNNTNKKLIKENKKLKKENKKLKKFKKEILTSKSLKITKPLRDIKNWRI